MSTYNFDREARIVCEAIDSKVGHMTVMCALREAFSAGIETAAAKGRPKPVCVACGMFYRVRRNGYAWEERMPGPGAAKRERRVDPDPNVEDVEPFHGLGVIPMLPGPLDGWQPYKLWVGDLWECPGCSAQIVVGNGANPLAEHFHPDYEAQVIERRVELRVDDC